LCALIDSRMDARGHAGGGSIALGTRWEWAIRHRIPICKSVAQALLIIPFEIIVCNWFYMHKVYSVYVNATREAVTRTPFERRTVYVRVDVRRGEP
jgi:hypothetical protein